MVEKAFAKRLPWAGWTYSFAKKRKVYGMHVVVLLWCSADRSWRIPVAFRLWRPKRACAPHRYQTKLELAARMLTEVRAAGLPCSYLVMDTHDTAGWFTRLAGRPWSGATTASRSPSWPDGCAFRGGRCLAYAPRRSPSMHPATAGSGWS